MTTLCRADIDPSIFKHLPTWMPDPRTQTSPPEAVRVVPRLRPLRAVTPVAAGGFSLSPEGHPKENDND